MNIEPRPIHEILPDLKKLLDLLAPKLNQERNSNTVTANERYFISEFLNSLEKTCSLLDEKKVVEITDFPLPLTYLLPKTYQSYCHEINPDTSYSSRSEGPLIITKFIGQESCEELYKLQEELLSRLELLGQHKNQLDKEKENPFEKNSAFRTKS